MLKRTILVDQVVLNSFSKLGSGTARHSQPEWFGNFCCLLKPICLIPISQAKSLHLLKMNFSVVIGSISVVWWLFNGPQETGGESLPSLQ